MSDRVIHAPDGKEIKAWRCSHCGHILAMVTDKGCIVCHPVMLHDKVVAVRCPVCGEYEPWRYDVRVCNS